MEKLKVQVWIHFRAPEGLLVLLLKMNEERGGFWQPVTGAVEDGESLASAALREASEESGLAFDGAPIELGMEFTFEGRGPRAGQQFREHVFGLLSRTPMPVRLDPREHDEYRWLAPREARALLHFEANAEGLEALLRKIAPLA